jgi:hypothetical protein
MWPGVSQSSASLVGTDRSTLILRCLGLLRLLAAVVCGIHRIKYVRASPHL